MVPRTTPSSPCPVPLSVPSDILSSSQSYVLSTISTVIQYNIPIDYLTRVPSLALRIYLSFTTSYSPRFEPTPAPSYKPGLPMYHARSPKPSDQPSNIPSLSIIRTVPRTYYPTFHTTLHVLANIKTLCTTLT